MTRTTVEFRGQQAIFRTQSEAYVWLLDAFLSVKGDFFAAGRIDRRGAREGVYFGESAVGMDQPKKLANGWYAETRLSELQKVSWLYLIAQNLGLSSEHDYVWQSDGRPHIPHQDVSTLLAQLGISAESPIS